VDVAILEPNDFVLILLRRACDRWGFSAVGSGDARELPDLMDAQPRLWLVASDADGPRTSALFHALRRGQPDRPVLLLVGAVESDDSGWIWQADGRLIKPLELMELRRQVERCLGASLSDRPPRT